MHLSHVEKVNRIAGKIAEHINQNSVIHHISKVFQDPLRHRKLHFLHIVEEDSKKQRKHLRSERMLLKQSSQKLEKEKNSQTDHRHFLKARYKSQQNDCSKEIKTISSQQLVNLKKIMRKIKRIEKYKTIGLSEEKKQVTLSCSLLKSNENAENSETIEQVTFLPQISKLSPLKQHKEKWRKKDKRFKLLRQEGQVVPHRYNVVTQKIDKTSLLVAIRQNEQQELQGWITSVDVE